MKPRKPALHHTLGGLGMKRGDHQKCKEEYENRTTEEDQSEKPKIVVGPKSSGDQNQRGQDHHGDTREGLPEGHHDLSHHQNKDDRIEKVAQIDHWYVQQFAKFLKKLDATNDIDGNSLLHNSMIVYGSGNADANRHTHEDLPVVLAGNGGGSLASGRHGSEPMSNLFLNLADRMGVEGWDRFGDSTGRLTNI